MGLDPAKSKEQLGQTPGLEEGEPDTGARRDCLGEHTAASGTCPPHFPGSLVARAEGFLVLSKWGRWPLLTVGL